MTADSVLSALIEVKGAREAIRAAESVQGALREARNEAVLATNAVNRFGRTRGIAVLDIDSAKAQAQLQAAEKSVQGFARERGSATLDADAGRVRLVTAEATRQVRQFGATKATAVLDTDTSKITALGGELRRAGGAVDGLGSNFDGLHKSKTKTDTLIDKNVGTFGKLSQSIRGTSNATGGLRGNLGPLSGGLGILSTAALVLGTALLAIAGPAIAVVAALGPLVGLTAAVAGGLVAAAQGFAVFKLATSGVSDALKEQNTASRTAGSTALAQAGQQVSAARAIQGAQESLRGAREATARASRAVDEATRSERQAIAALGPAYTEARTRIRDLRDAVTGANLSLRDARFAANDARKALTDLLGGPSPRVLADAHLAVADAMRGERSAALGLADATKALNDLLAPPAVLDLADARDAVADATRGQTRAQLDLAKQLTATNAVLADPGASEADKADARLRLADAENAVGDAARTSARAQEALSKLESPAAQDEIAKARGRVQDAEAAVALAKRDSRDAQAQLAKVESPAASDEIAKARLALAQAENQLSTATRDGARAASEYRTAEAQGIAQSPSVLAAREQLRAAALAGADAERALTDAQRAQGIAARGVSEAQADAARSAGVAAAAATNLSQKFDALPPAAQAFVRVLQSLKPRLDELRSTAASGFFPGATAGLKAAEGSFGAINSVVGETALVLGDAARKSGELVGSPAFAKDIQTIGSNNAKVLGTFGEALRHIISAFRHVVVAAGPLTQWLADVANKWALNAAESAKAGRETGKLAAFFEKTKAVAQRLGSILGSLGSGLLGVGKAGTATGNDILLSIDRAAKRFDEWANSVKGQSSIREFFEKTREIAAALLPALGNLAAGFTFLALKVLPVVTALQLLGPLADEAIIAFVSYKLAITAAAIASKAWAVGAGIAAIATGGWTTAFWALNAALVANPIGLVIVALLAIGAALVVAYKKSETFRDIVDGAFQAVKNVATAVFPAIVATISTAWAVIKAVTTAAWLLINAAIVTPLRAARDTISEVVTGIANRLAAAWLAITGAASATWGGVRDTILGAVRAARDTISEVVTGIGTRLATGWATIKAAVTVAWDAVRSGILDPVRAARDAIGGVVEGIGNRIGAGWTAILAGARDFARDIKDAIVRAVTGAANAVLGLVNDIIGVINKIPGVEIPKIKELAQGGVNAAKGGPSGNGTLARSAAYARGGFFGATGGFMDRPVAIGGEESPTHPEYVIPTNPAYRGRAQMLLGQAAGAIGFAEGGVVSAFKSAIKTTGASEKPALALFEAGIVESGLRNLTYGDADSLGALQLRAGIHGRALALDPLGSALAFLTRGFTGRGGAISLADNYDTAGQVAQAVQGSAFPDRYDQVRGQAQEFLKGGGGIGGAIKGLIGNVGGVVGDLLSKGAGFLLDKLPGVGGLPDFLKGTGKYLLDKASSAIKDKVGNLLSSATGGNAGADLPKGVSGSISDAIGLAQSLGFAKPSVGQLTGGKHAPGSYHYQGRAADFGDAGHTAKQMDALYDALRAKFGANIKELFYDKEPSYVKNGQSIAGQFGGHGDHIHIALAKGGVYGGGLLGSYAAGTDYVPQTGPYLLHKGESVAPAAQGGGEYGRGNVIITGPVTMGTDQQASVLASKLAFQLKYGFEMADLSAISLNDAAGVAVVLHNGTTRAVTQVTGLAGITAPRRSVRPRPTAHGTIDETRWTDEAIITIEGYVRGTTDAAAFNEFRLVTAPMLATLEAGALLKWTEDGGGLSLQRTVKLSGAVDAPLKADGVSLLRYQVALAAADPRAYSQALTTAAGTALSVLGGGLTFPMTFNFDFASSGGGTVSFTNTGNRPAPVIFRLQGGWTNASIVNLGTGARINLVGSISGSDYLDVNTFDRTILLNGMSSRSNFYDAATSQWADAQPGVNNYQMTAASFDGTATITVIGRSAYA